MQTLAITHQGRAHPHILVNIVMNIAHLHSIHCAASCAVPCFTWYKTISSKKHPNSSPRVNDALHVQSLGNFCFIVGCFPSRGCTGAGRLWVCPLARGVRFLAKLSVQSLVTLAPHFSTAPPGSIWTHKNLIWRSRPPLFFGFKNKICAEFGNDPKIFFRTLRDFLLNAPKNLVSKAPERNELSGNVSKKSTTFWTMVFRETPL